MLIELNIRNIALIESLRIEFTRGLNVLTGETFESHDGHITLTVEACKACLLEL